jgi:hypothetical protein
MLNRTQLIVICKRLEQSLREAGFVFFDIQFDEAAQTLRIVLKKSADRGSASLTREDRTARGTIDARLLGDVLRNLNKLGVRDPAIQLREADRAEAEAREFSGGADSPPFSGR